MLFSVIIPTYNRRVLLLRTLDSVWAQHFTDYEVIVVDDGSTDGTLEQLAALGSRVTVLTQANRGPGAARNLGAAAAKGEYLAFLDSDDLWFPWSLKTYALVVQQHGLPSFIAGCPWRFRDEAALAEVRGDALTVAEFSDYLASGDEWRWWGVSSFVIRATVFRERGGFAEANMNGEDADLALRLGTAAGFVQIIAPVTFGYREHEANVTADLSKSLAGLWHKLRMEKTRSYPGGDVRALERWRILTRHVRPVMLACLRGGRRAEAWRLYRTTWGWHLALRRWKVVLGFPVVALLKR